MHARTCESSCKRTVDQKKKKKKKGSESDSMGKVRFVLSLSSQSFLKNIRISCVGVITGELAVPSDLCMHGRVNHHAPSFVLSGTCPQKLCYK